MVPCGGGRVRRVDLETFYVPRVPGRRPPLTCTRKLLSRFSAQSISFHPISTTTNSSLHQYFFWRFGFTSLGVSQHDTTLYQPTTMSQLGTRSRFPSLFWLASLPLPRTYHSQPLDPLVVVGSAGQKKKVKKEQTLCTTSERARLEFLTQLARSVPVCVRGMRFSRALVAVGLLVFGVYPEWALGEGLGHGKLGHRITARRLERAQGLGISHRNHGGSIIHSRSLPSYPCGQIQPEIACTLRILGALRGMVGQHLPSDGTCIYSQVLPAQQYVHVNGQSVCCIDGRPNSVRTRNQRSIVARCNSAHNFLFSPPAPPAGRLVYPSPPLLGQKLTWKSMFRRHGLPAEGAVPDCCWQLFLL